MTVSAGFVALLFLAPVAIPIGQLDVGGTVRSEVHGSNTPPQGFSQASSVGLPGGDVTQLTFRLGDHSVVLTWTRRP